MWKRKCIESDFARQHQMSGFHFQSKQPIILPTVLVASWCCCRCRFVGSGVCCSQLLENRFCDSHTITTTEWRNWIAICQITQSATKADISNNQPKCLICTCWRRGVVVIRVRQWTKLTHVGHSYNWDEWPSSGRYTISGFNQPTRSTQPCIPPGSLNRVPALAGVKAGMSPVPGGR